MNGIDSHDKVSCVIIFFGANDAAHESCPSGQHVPIDEFKENLKKMVEMLESSGIKKERVILVNNPTYYHDDFSETKGEDMVPCRSAESAATYAAACLEAGKEIGVTSIDIHKMFAEDPRGRRLFTDGLHFSPSGSELLLNEIWPFIEKKVHEFSGTSSLEQQLPYWMSIRETFKTKCSK